MASNNDGILYVVATPIGNLADIGQRALAVLRDVDLIAAEDTRKTRILLRQYAISTPLRAYHEHNEQEEAPRLAARLQQGERIALVSDAGTPLVSDPGYRLVSESRRLGLQVVPVPGPSALICALSASGLASDRFLFAGFPPRKSEQRERFFRSFQQEPGTLIFYESSHRIEASLAALCKVFGDRRKAVLARELSKLHETFLQGTPCALARQLEDDPMQRKGEHVLLLEGAGHEVDQSSADVTRLLRILLEDLPVKQAAALAARISGEKKNELYRLALSLQ
jgi:16S rRNA (cytidine1402-2'-O)-methyltransferase